MPLLFSVGYIVKWCSKCLDNCGSLHMRMQTRAVQFFVLTPYEPRHLKCYCMLPCEQTGAEIMLKKYMVLVPPANSGQV